MQDGGRSSDDDQVIVIGATNRPQDLDQAALRRFGRHMYVPLPDAKVSKLTIAFSLMFCTRLNRLISWSQVREKMIINLLCESPIVKANLSSKDIKDIVASSALYSAADLTNVCKDAALTPLREMEDITGIQAEDVWKFFSFIVQRYLQCQLI